MAESNSWLTRRGFLKLGVAAGMTTLLAACGGTAPSPGAATQVPASQGQPAQGQTTKSEWGAWPSYSTEPQQKVGITVAHAWDAVFMETQKKFDQDFMQRHPNIQVTAENTPWGEFLTKYLTQAAAGTLPDIIYLQFAWAQKWIQQGSLIALDDHIKQQKDFNIEDFTPPSMVSYKYKNQLYVIPYDEGPGLIYVNKDMFKKYGADLPKPGWTMDDFLATAKKITQGDGPTKTFGFNGLPRPDDGGMQTFGLFPFGARFMNEEKTQCLIDSPDAVKAMQWWWDWYFVHKVVPSPADLQTVQGDPFTFGKIGMMYTGTWGTPPLRKDAKFDWDVYEFPKGPVKHSTFSEGSGYAITKLSKQQDVAWIYLNDFLSTPGMSFMWGITGRGSPARISAWESYWKSPTPPSEPQKHMILDALKTYASHDLLDTPNGPEVSNAVKPIWDRVVAGELQVPDACKQVVAAANPILAKNKAS